MLIKNVSKRGGGLNFQDWHDYPVGEQLLFRERWDELLTLLGKNHAHIGVSLLFTELGRLRMGYDQARTAIEIVQKIKQYCGEDFLVILRFSLKSYIKNLRQGAMTMRPCSRSATAAVCATSSAPSGMATRRHAVCNCDPNTFARAGSSCPGVVLASGGCA